ncbi:hypothetical protein Pelo_18945 [Pelomyxa schiedti]|nr:hypothetical protein Pelo_18945 [Pelomyxa schiedti]
MLCIGVRYLFITASSWQVIKAQGQTLGGGTVVDLAIPPTGPSPKHNGWAIVALARCKNWNSLYLLRSIPDKVLTQGLPAEYYVQSSPDRTHFGREHSHISPCETSSTILLCIVTVL